MWQQRRKMAYSIVSNERLEVETMFLLMSCYPVDCEAAVARTSSHSPIVVDLGVELEREVETCSKILDRFSAPIVLDGVGEALAKRRAAGRIDGEHEIAVLSEDLRIPPRAPLVLPGTLWPTMDEQYNWPSTSFVVL